MQEQNDDSRQDMPRGDGRRVLVVDDEPVVRDLCQQALEDFGYRVSLACDGLEGVEAYGRARQGGEPFDLVIMDLAMPRMDGRAAALAIREQDPGARIVVTTGRGGGRDAASLQPPAQGILHKPFALKDLLQELRRVMGD